MPKQKKLSLEEQIAGEHHKMTVADREQSEREIEEMESRVKKSDLPDGEYESGSKDPRALEQRIKDKKARLEYDQELDARGHKKDMLAAEKAKIEDELKRGICSKTEMWVKDPSEHARAVAKNYAWQQQHGERIRRLQEINMRLEPENPSAQSIEYLRSER